MNDLGDEKMEEQMQSLWFSKGSRVEVSSDEDGFKGAWYVATVLDTPPPPPSPSPPPPPPPSSSSSKKKKRKRQSSTTTATNNNEELFLVQYETLSEDADPDTPLTESVRASFMRPLPPPTDNRERTFQLNDVVDAYHREGWWIGVIVEVLKNDDGDGSRFAVCFEIPPDVIEFEASDLRLHRDWVDGHWVQPHKQKIEEPKCVEKQHRKIRGRPPKCLVARRKGESHRGAAGALSETITSVCMTNEADFSTLVGMVLSGSGSFNEQPFDSPGKKFLRGPLRRSEVCSPLAKQIADNASPKKAKQLGKNVADGHQISPLVNTLSQTQDSQVPEGKSSEVIEVCSGTKDLAIVISEMTNGIFDEQPLFRWLERMRSSTVVMNLGLHHERALVHCDEASNWQNSIVMKSPEVVANNGSVEICQMLPFVKSSPVWKSIESLEVFQKMPQWPHFSPLAEWKEDSREGLAIGHMVTFANMLERASNLRLSDPKSIMERSLETLIDLEKHGFNVEVLRARLSELISVKDKLGHLEAESKRVESELMKHNLEQTGLDKEISEVETKIRDLKEILALAASTKERKEKEIATLQSKVSIIIESIRSAELEFERLSTSLL